MIFIPFNIYLTFINVTLGKNLSGNLLLYWKSSDFLLHFIIRSCNIFIIFPLFMGASCPLFLSGLCNPMGHVSLHVAVITAKFSLLSSVIVALSLVLQCCILIPVAVCACTTSAKCAQGSQLKVRISSRYDVQKSLSTSFMAASSILLYTLLTLANPNSIRIYWNMPNGLINAVHT